MLRQNENIRTDMNYRLLANAIVIRAAKDYVVLHRLRRYFHSKESCATEMKRQEKYRAKVEEIDRLICDNEDFFNSPWCSFLTDADPEYLQAKLKEVCCGNGR